MSDFKLDCFIRGVFLGVKVKPPRAGSDAKPKRIAVISVPVIGGLAGECSPVELVLSNSLNPHSGISATPDKFIGQSLIFPVGLSSWSMNNASGVSSYLNAEPFLVLDAE